jgi:hypothetical protein
VDSLHRGKEKNVDRDDRLRLFERASRREMKEMSLRLADTELTSFSCAGIATDYGKEGWPLFIDIRVNGVGTYYIYTLRFMAEDILRRAEDIRIKKNAGVKLNAGGTIQYIFGLY